MLNDDPEEKRTLIDCAFAILVIMVLLIFFIDVHLIKNDLHRIANSIEKISE